MPKFIASAEPIEAVGNKHKICEEYVGVVNSGDEKVSITVMHSPAGWQGVAHYSKFHEYAVVLRGQLQVQHAGGTIEASAGQAVHIEPDEEVIFATPSAEGCEYMTGDRPTLRGK